MSFLLTDKGMHEATKIGKPMGPETQVIAFLYQQGDNPVEIEEIQDDTKMSDEKTIRVMNRLVSMGLVREI